MPSALFGAATDTNTTNTTSKTQTNLPESKPAGGIFGSLLNPQTNILGTNNTTGNVGLFGGAKKEEEKAAQIIPSAFSIKKEG